MSKIILGLVGEIASGKGTAVEYLKEKGAVGFRFSTILRDLLGRLYLSESRENMQDLAESLRIPFGEGILSQAISEDVRASDEILIVIDGVRKTDELVHLKKIEGFYLINISADSKMRFDRITKRSENSDDRGKTLEQFQEDSKNPAELQIREVAEQAEFRIDNNGTREELFKQVDEILEKIKNEN